MVAAPAEQDATDQAGAAEHQQDQGDGLPLQAGHMLQERFQVTVGGEVRRHAHDDQDIDADQGRAPKQDRQAGERATVLTGQGGQQADQKSSTSISS